MENSVSNLGKEYKAPSMRFYRTVVKLLSGCIRVLFRVKIQGRENMPKTGACFVCCNHISNWDPVLLAVAVKRPVHFMAKVQLFRVPVLKHLLKALGAFSVDRDNTDITAIKTAFTHIKHGEPVGIFPQGRRLRGEAPSADSIKNGTGMMVYRTQADVVPVSIYTKHYKVRLFRRVYVNIGKPIQYAEYDAGSKSPEEYQRISNIIFTRICTLDAASRETAQRGKARTK